MECALKHETICVKEMMAQKTHGLQEQAQDHQHDSLGGRAIRVGNENQRELKNKQRNEVQEQRAPRGGVSDASWRR